MTNAEYIARKLNIPVRNVENVISLLGEGATIPFISRYRKEATGSLDEVAIFEIEKESKRLEELAARKEYVIATIDSQGKLTDELRRAIEETFDSNLVEDLYLPFKPKRRTRAQIARERGLEPLADMILKNDRRFSVRDVEAFIDSERGVADAESAIAGASDIIAERVSESQRARSYVRGVYQRHANIAIAPTKGKEEEAANFENYFKFSSKLNRCSSHQVLAIMRGINEGLLKYDMTVDDDIVLERLNGFYIKGAGSADAEKIISEAIKDGYRRLMQPSMENEMLAEAKARADEAAIKNFADNLRQLLLAAPLGSKRVLAIDPGFRTGCKVVCLDANGNLLHHDVIYPTPPHNDLKAASRKISDLVDKYDINAISLGNGTASRETERFLKSCFLPEGVEIYVVNENGASVYSASKIARDEFPDHDVTVRGAVSIGRRLMDPLAELVKIDPKSIGVGQYQHDVDQKKLKESLDATVEACVNSVGVDLNTASAELLSYVSGIGPAMAKNIVAYRADNGDFHHREDILGVPRFGAKAYQQAAGFLRIPASDRILDNTAVHPESYRLVERMASDTGLKIDELVRRPEVLKSIDLQKYVDDKVGLPTLQDIIKELEKPGRDPRGEAGVFEFAEGVNDITDLYEGMELPGIINNITDFGAFVDIGVHVSGLVHISQISDKRVRHPSEAVKLNQHVNVRVIGVDVARKRISLSMKS